MGWLHKIGFRLQPLFSRRRIEAELADEIQVHLEMQAEANARAGMPPEEAVCAARREFGGVEQIKERFRDERGFPWIERIRLDLLYASRSLLKTPAFSAVAVLSMAAGVGAASAILGLVHASLFRPLPYPAPDRLVQLTSMSPEGTRFPYATGPGFKVLQDRSTSFEGLAIVHAWDLNLIGDGRAERVGGVESSTDLLRVLGLEPVLGTGFAAGDAAAGGRPVVLLTYEGWQDLFAGDPAMVGRSINLSRVPRTVIGVLPPHALPLEDVSVIVPIPVEGNSWRSSLDSLWAPVLGRLKPGVTLDAANREVAGINRQFYGNAPHAVAYRTEFVPLQGHLAEGSRPALFTLFGAVVLLLAIVWANLTNLLLARASLRQRETALRAALGASAGRIACQGIVECLLLALLGGILGIGVAWIGVGVLDRMMEGVLPAVMRPAMDLRLAATCLLLALGAGLLIGSLPALVVRRGGGVRALREGGRAATPASRTALQSASLVVAVALTLTLLIDGGLLLRSLSKILSADPGFKPHHTIGCDISLTVPRFKSWMSVVRFEHDIETRLASVPGIEAVGTAGALPLRGPRGGPEGLIHGSVRVALSGHSDHRDEVEAGLDLVAGDYFGAMGIRLLEGRLITDSDNRLNAPPVVVINDRLANLLAPGRSAIGLSVRSTGGVGGEVVGVVGSVRDRRLDAPPDPRIYGPQVVNPWNCSVVLRTTLPPAALVDRIRTEIGGILPDQSIANFRSLDEDVSVSLQQRSVPLQVLGVFAVLAFGLACLGLYGVVDQAIGRRRRELCVRMALGAQPGDVVRLVWRDGLRLGLVGMACGLAGAAIGARLIESRLYEVSAFDPLVFLSMTTLLAAATVTFVYLPARRVARLDASLVLRSE
jgi:predicted permease